MTDWFNEPFWSAHQTIWWICLRDPEFQGYEPASSLLTLDLILTGCDDAFDNYEPPAKRRAPKKGRQSKIRVELPGPEEKINIPRESDVSVYKALDDLRLKLQGCEIRCVATNAKSGERGLRQRHDWAGLQIWEWPEGVIVARKNGAVIYTDLQFERVHVLRTWPKEKPSAVARPGRPPGTRYNDDALLTKMYEGMQDGTYPSKWAAANAFAGDAEGGGTLKSKAKRLSKRYSEKFTN